MKLWEVLGERFGMGARMRIAIGALVIVLGTIAAGVVLLRPDYQVLFADLSPEDTAAMTAELDRLKIPYVLGDQQEGQGTGASIFVERGDVYKTRIKLMGRDIPLHGAVGFELFNNSDLGMTEFAQKINYQRALQGELTKTILALTEIRDVRILLALPEQGLFKQAANNAKASVTLTFRPGQSLRPEQVNGIQRLVAAAVPGIAAGDVTIVDQSGVALTRVAGDGAGDAEAMGAYRLDLKKETEGYLSRKATSVLERALGAGQASATVDVTLNMERVQSNTDEVIGAPAKPGETPTGVITRERESTHDAAVPVSSTGATTGVAGAAGGSSQHETEYALGHRTEQVVALPGSIRRIQVAVVVARNLGPQQTEQVRQMVAAAVGASLDRGDSVVVQVMDGSVSRSHENPNAAVAAAADRETRPAARAMRVGQTAKHGGDSSASSSSSTDAPWSRNLLTAIGAGGLLLGALVWTLAWRRPSARAVALDRRLTDVERREALTKIRLWMRDAGSEPVAVPSVAASLDRYGPQR